MSSVHRLAPIAVAALVSFFDLRPSEPARFRGPPPAFGQWIWSDGDRALFDEATPPPAWPAPTAAVFVGTVIRDGAGVTSQKARDPAGATSSGGAVVVRFDDSLHRGPDASHEEVSAALADLLSQVDAVRTSGEPLEVQLDYDVPRSHLPRWVTWVRGWSEGLLAGHRLWVTSIPDHLRHDDYGALLRGAVEGHIVQVFDTGSRCDDASERSLRRDLRRHDLPFRVGVGAFERGPRTEHGCWSRRWRGLASAEGFAGLWVFPAGHRYDHLWREGA